MLKINKNNSEKLIQQSLILKLDGSFDVDVAYLRTQILSCWAFYISLALCGARFSRSTYSVNVTENKREITVERQLNRLEPQVFLSLIFTFLSDKWGVYIKLETPVFINLIRQYPATFCVEFPMIPFYQHYRVLDLHRRLFLMKCLQNIWLVLVVLRMGWLSKK